MPGHTHPNYNDFCQTDNSSLSVYMQLSLSATGKSRIQSRLNNEFSPTDLGIVYEVSAVYSWGGETDIIYQFRSDIQSGFAGVTWCDDAFNNDECDQHYVAFDAATPSSAVACHETGRAVGLTHGHVASPTLPNTDSSLGCMTNPPAYTTLGFHNVSEINDEY